MTHHPHKNTMPLPSRNRAPIATTWLDKIHRGDCVRLLAEMPPESVDLVVTSPPYFRQRNYAGLGIGNEPRVEEYISALTEGFSEVLRVVKPSGNIVYNLGDKYWNGGLLLAPFRFALAVCGSFPVSLVNNITWVKSNPTPRQYKRRLVSSTEPFFHFAKSDGYYYNRDAFNGGNGHAPVAELAPAAKSSPKMGERYRALLAESSLTPAEKRAGVAALERVLGEARGGKIHSFRMKIRGVHAPAFGGQNGGRNNQMQQNGFTVIRIQGKPMKRDVLESAVESGNGSGHPAVFPTKIVRDLVRMLCPPDGVVLDPYAGSGATLVAAKQEGRKFVGMDVNSDYCKYASDWTKKI